ncbi:MAG: Zn-dependent hydrolase [Chloroflexota bacterium]|nr:Zn-dependent hydrolase [Chloroflexota bacterium]
MHLPPIDRSTLEARIATMAGYGKVGETGVTRTVFSPEWVAANDQLAAWMGEAGLNVRMDAAGNLWGRIEGSDNRGSIVSGSHVDSQAPGGRFDGVLGIIAALTSVESLVRELGPPRRTLEVVSLCEEEGSRFPTAGFWGSRAILGLITPDDVENTVSFTGEKIGDVMRSVGLDPTELPAAVRNDIDAFIELHIEQGPILESEGLPVGIVTGITGYRHFDVTIRGTANHAGAFPMDLRRDPMAAAAEIISGVINTAHRMGRPAVTTVGRITADPNYPAIVPDSVRFTIDARHPDAEQRDLLYARHTALIQEVGERRNVDVEMTFTKDLGPRPCDPEIVQLLAAAAGDLGIPHRLLPSGAVHDTQRFSEIARTAMIFVQSRDGRSHTPNEFTETEHAALGIEVLREGLRRLAYGDDTHG